MANLTDIAKRVGLSTSTVSRVLNHDITMSVSQDNREAIFAVAAELHYMTPRGRRRQTRALPAAPVQVQPAQASVAVFHFLNPDRELADPFMVSMRAGIESAALRQKFQVIRVFPEDGRLLPSMLTPAAGAVIIGPRSPDEMKMLADAYPRRVYADLPRKWSVDADAVESDLDGVTARLVDDLVQRGFKRIGYVGWSEPGAGLYGERRAAALVARLRELDRFASALVALGEESPAGGAELTRRLLQLPEPPDVIVAGTDTMAIGVYRAAHELGVRVPRDVAVVGYNDNPISAFMSPTLSTVSVPAHIIGSTAVDLLAEQLQGRQTPKRVIFEGRMIWRESTGR